MLDVRFTLFYIIVFDQQIEKRIVFNPYVNNFIASRYSLRYSNYVYLITKLLGSILTIYPQFSYSRVY